MVSLDISWWMLALIGIGVIGVILVIDVILLSRYDRKRFQADLETEEHTYEMIKLRTYLDTYINKTDNDMDRVRNAVLEHGSKIDELYRLLDRVQDTVTDHSSEIYNQESAISDLTEEVYSYRDLTDSMAGDIKKLKRRIKRTEVKKANDK